MHSFPFLDNNECLLASHNCHTNATCVNTNGSFTCSCNNGYSGNGISCEGKLRFDTNLKDSRTCS